jgi:hypothetical protein
MPIFIEF